MMQVCASSGDGTCLMRVIGFAALFATFEERVC